MKKISVILLLAALLLTACNPLRRVQRNQKADSTVVDRSEIRKIVTDIIRESGTLTQTVVEYYPPTVTTDPVTPTEPSEIPFTPDISAIAAEPSAILSPAVKRIIKTEINTASERVTTTDSVAHNDIHTTMHSELSDKVVEKPPATVTAINGLRWGLWPCCSLS